MNEQTVIMCLEPSKELSKLCGFPHFIERRFTADELVRQGIINENDIIKMRQGKEICKRVPLIKEGSQDALQR